MSTTEEFSVTFTISGTFLCDVEGTDPEERASDILTALKERAGAWMDDVKITRSEPVNVAVAAAEIRPRLNLIVSLPQGGLRERLARLDDLLQEARGVGTVVSAKLSSLPDEMDIS